MARGERDGGAARTARKAPALSSVRTPERMRGGDDFAADTEPRRAAAGMQRAAVRRAQAGTPAPWSSPMPTARRWRSRRRGVTRRAAGGGRAGPQAESLPRAGAGSATAPSGETGSGGEAFPSATSRTRSGVATGSRGARSRSRRTVAGRGRCQPSHG